MLGTKFLILLILCFSSFEGKEDQKIYVKAVKCIGSVTYLYPNYTCYAKSFNRSCSTATAMFFFKKPQNNLFVGSIFVSVIMLPKNFLVTFLKAFVNRQVSIRQHLPRSVEDAPIWRLQIRWTNWHPDQTDHCIYQLVCTKCVQALPTDREKFCCLL